MKIVLATPLFPPEIGGPATYTKELAERLLKDHEVSIVAYASTSEIIQGTTLYIASKRRPLPIRLIKYTLLMWHATKGADVIYVQNAMAAGLPAVLIGKIRKVPVVLKFVGDEAWEHAQQEGKTTKRLEEFLANPDAGIVARLRMAVQGFVLRRVNIVTAPSEYLLSAVCKTYNIPKDRAQVNYNASEKEEIVPLPNTPIKHQIVTTARLVKWKGIDGIIRATALLAKRFPDVHTTIAGDGPEENAFKTLAEELGVSKHVTFLGRVSRAETWHLRKTSEVYVLNSTYEGLPHTVLTSFAAGIPTVATDIPGTNEALFHMQTGLLVPPNNPQALSEAIERLFENEQLRADLVEGASKLLEEKFSWEAHLNRLDRFFNSVCSKPIS